PQAHRPDQTDMDGDGKGDACDAVNVIAIDIKPRTNQNPVAPIGRGLIGVAILSSLSFDARTVEEDSVRFGPAGATSLAARVKDVDGDGDLDMLLEFRGYATGINIGDSQ